MALKRFYLKLQSNCTFILSFEEAPACEKNSYCFDILMKLPVFMSCFSLLCDVMILHKATGGALLSVFKLRIVPIEDTH